MSVKLLTAQHLEFLSLTGGCTGLSESIHVKMPHCWKSHVAAHLQFYAPFSRFIQASLCKIQGLLNDFPTVFKD